MYDLPSYTNQMKIGKENESRQQNYNVQQPSAVAVRVHHSPPNN